MVIPSTILYKIGIIVSSYTLPLSQTETATVVPFAFRVWFPFNSVCFVWCHLWRFYIVNVDTLPHTDTRQWSRFSYMNDHHKLAWGSQKIVTRAAAFLGRFSFGSFHWHLVASQVLRRRLMGPAFIFRCDREWLTVWMSEWWANLSRHCVKLFLVFG